MEVSLIQQLTVSLYSVIMGAVFGLIYDIFRISRIFFGINYVNRFTEKIKNIKLPLIENPMIRESKIRNESFKSVVVGIGDILYFTVITPIAVIFVYHFNNGNVRWYIIAGIAIGFTVSYFTVGKIIISVSEYIVFFIKIFFSYVSYFILSPLKRAFLFLFGKTKKFLGFLKSKIPKVHSKNKKMATDKKKVKKPLIYIGKIT